MTLPASGAISFSNINVELCRSSTAQLSLNDSCLRTLFGQASGAVCMNTGHGKTNTSVPGIPTGVSASATSSSAISVSFSAPGCTGHLAIDYYQVVCTSSGSNSATGSSSPISVSGLSASTSYTFKVRAHNSKGYGCYSSSTGTATTSAVRGSATYTTSGSYTWVAPSGVTRISTFTVGGGGGGNRGWAGGGAGSMWRNNWPVTSGGSHTVQVGTYGSINVGYNSQSYTHLRSSYIRASYSTYGSAFIAIGPFGGNSCGNSNGQGGSASVPTVGTNCNGNSYSCGYGICYVMNNRCGSTYSRQQGGPGNYTAAGGAAGYGHSGNISGGYGSGNPGTAGGGWGWMQGTATGANGNPCESTYFKIACGPCGAGGGGAGRWDYSSGTCYFYAGGGGGGVGLCGQGTNGSRGIITGSGSASIGYGGSGGSGGASGTNRSCQNGGQGGAYGGGGGGGNFYYNCWCGYVYNGQPSIGYSGAVVILWPGCSRSYPSTDTTR